MELYLPTGSHATGTGVIVCPGGGYTILAWDKEGTRIAEWLNSIGVAAFVLKYRLPHWESEDCRDKVALLDAQRAIRLVRSKAEEWQLEPDRIGIMGFSAGGHLASTVSTHFDYGNPNASNPVDRFSCRPDFSILMYPVVTMDTVYGHTGSRRNLIGENADDQAIQHFSNAQQITAETPPALLIHADDDRGVLAENSVEYYLGLRKFGIPAALHIYEDGGHGFGLAEDYGSVSGWPKVAEEWMGQRGYLSKRIQVLLVNNDPNEATIKGHLQNNDRFTVRAVQMIAQIDFTPYDVVVLNYDGPMWPESVREDFEAYLRRGGGLVVLPTANMAFAEWDNYVKMIGLTARENASGNFHYFDTDDNWLSSGKAPENKELSASHTFEVKVRNPEHPVIKGLPETWWHRSDRLFGGLRGPGKDLNILASALSVEEHGGTGRQEPVLMTVHYGMGRVFHSTLGIRGQYEELLQSIILRGIEWAASGRVTQALPKNIVQDH